jgi:hypothetical protein
LSEFPVRELPKDPEGTAATGTQGFAAPAQLPTCFHELTHACSLDPPRLAGFSPERGGPHAVHRLLQSSGPTSTPCELSEPGEPCLRSDARPVTRPLAGKSQPKRSESGVARRLPFRPPQRRPLAVRIYPDSTRFEHPLVASLTPPSTGKGRQRRPTVAIPRFEDQLALANQAEAWPRPRPWLAFRAAGPIAPREWHDGRLHPGCLPPVHPHSRAPFWGACDLRGGDSTGGFPRSRWSLARATPFRPERAKILTGTEVLSARPSLRESDGRRGDFGFSREAAVPGGFLRSEGPKADVPRNFQGRISQKGPLLANKKCVECVFFCPQGYPQLLPNMWKPFRYSK